MRLMTVTLESFRRFENRTKVDVAGAVVALVGPNEAGKSSILAAMCALNDEEEIPFGDRTRDAPEAACIHAGYVLEDRDKEQLASIQGGNEVKWWILVKRQNGRLTCDPQPSPKRDLSRRHALADKLRQMHEAGQIAQLVEATDSATSDRYADLSELLSSENEEISNVDYETIREFGELHENVDVLDEVQESDLEDDAEGISADLHALLVELASYDEGPHPRALVARRLLDLRPKFLEFTEEDRYLQTSYDLAVEMDEPPAALTNLASLAGLDLPRLLDAARRGDLTRRGPLLENANAQLQRIFYNDWTQSGLSVHLDMDRTVLQVLVQSAEGHRSEIEERSEGFRTFVALRAFLNQHDQSIQPIVLVDEAEQHLHYDAQADLVNVFTDQEYAAKIIYTTHSAGCLPRDLGTGIRAVLPDERNTRSSVSNNIWEGHKVGVSPVVFAIDVTPENWSRDNGSPPGRDAPRRTVCARVGLATSRSSAS